MSKGDKGGWFFVGFAVGMIILMAIILLSSYGSLQLSQETANDICHSLTGNNSSIARTVGDGSQKLVCEIPSFDHTTNIIIREAGAE